MMIVVMIIIIIIIIFIIMVVSHDAVQVHVRIAAKIMKVMLNPKLWSSFGKKVEYEVDNYSN